MEHKSGTESGLKMSNENSFVSGLGSSFPVAGIGPKFGTILELEAVPKVCPRSLCFVHICGPEEAIVVSAQPESEVAVMSFPFGPLIFAPLLEP